MKKIVTIGGATQDIFIEYAEMQSMRLDTKRRSQFFTLLGKGEKIEVKNIHYATGGGATNSAVSFKRLGFDVVPFFKIAADEPGKFIIHSLKEEKIITDYVVKNDEHTGISFVVPSLQGDCTILAYRGANAHLVDREISYDLINTANCLYITSLSGISAQLLLPITRYAHEHKILVANNPGKSQLMAGADILRQSLKYIDILILNSDEAQQLMLSLAQTSEQVQSLIAQTQAQAEQKKETPVLLRTTITIENICFNLRHFFQAVLSRGPRIVVVTNGAEGVYVATKDTIYFHPSLQTTIINTLGAGDAFGSCFAANIFLKKSVEQALVNGIINATSVISYLDAKTGLLNAVALEQRAREVGLDGVLQFALKG